MKRTMKLLPLLLAMLLLACACNAPSAAGNAPAAAGDYTKRLLKPTELVIGMSPDYPPYESLEGETLVGFDIELMEAVGESLGLEVVWSMMDFDTIIMAMQSGQVDCGVSGFTWTQERVDAGILFSTPYVDSAQVVFVHEESDIQTVEDLHGTSVYASLGTTGAMSLEDLGYEDLTIVPGSDYQMAFQMLAEKQVDGVAVDVGVGQSHIDNGRPFRALEPALLEEENHVVFAPGMEDVKTAVDGAIAEFMKTEAYKELRVKFGL